MIHPFPREQRQALHRAVRLLDVDKKKFSWSVLAGSSAIGSTVGLGATAAWMIARAAQLPPVLDLSVASVGVRAFGVGKAIFRYLERIASHWVALHGMATLRTQLYRELANSSTDVVTSLKRGDVLTRTNADVDEIGLVVVQSLLPMAVATLVSILTLGILGFLSPLIALIVAIALFISGIIGPLLAMTGAALAEQGKITTRAQLNEQSLYLLEHAEQLRVSGLQSATESSRQATEEAIWKQRDAAARYTALASGLDVLALALAVVGAIIVGSWQVSAGSLSEINLVVCVLTPLSAFEATARMPQAFIQLTRSGTAAQRVMAIIDQASTSPAATQTPVIARKTPLLAHNMVAGWPGNKEVSAPLNLHIEPGTSLAIVGPSGIGKSTILHTLAGLIKPHTGSVTLAQHPVSEIARSTLSHHISFTAEDAHIFDTSILENLRVARADITPEQARDLLAQAGLSSWLADLPDGVDTELGADAVRVSGGERRRLLLARAFASPADILLIDEPGEHLDPETADLLLRDILSASNAQRSVVVVTHRLTPLDAADHVIVLGPDDTGRATIVDEGQHHELLARNRHYAWSLAQEG
ncbi:thiol reductant ABC exporter subunit CydC [Arcanobacterium pinnipediorum]|uniref:Thiol reductant ABC exporter subunit CydC n=1 Tax=Arcanobacterium pinnipediorum TaxID=1503041 RepID=A0ABY5AGJ0_9ACTO|nr:thiol reductant ABC exporter subunit CydC [Arcanobacterium pinnipediorum]USR78836.1 thiol reductant ABC exporter subunit CydC [Arcanobacterium pinnipediorum]